MLHTTLKRIQLLILLCAWTASSAHAATSDSTVRYPWLKRDLAYIEFYDSSAFLPFVRKFRHDSRIVVAHLGDSHVQPDISTSILRNFLSASKGNAGRGFLFPYSAARTHSGFDYQTRSGGYWHSARNTDILPKLPLGIAGMTVRTTDINAWLSYSLKQEPPVHQRRLRIFCRRNPESFDLQLITDQGTLKIPVADSTQSPIEILLPAAPVRFTLRPEKTRPEQKELEIYGLSLESDQDEGSTVHALGVAGAPWRAILLESLFAEQARELAPDLVILDYGTNDYIPGNRIPGDMKIRIVDVIRTVRQALPETTILLTSTQDMNRRGLQMTAGRPLSKIIRQIAQEENCAFFDWYWISGGPGTMKDWVGHGLAQRDNIHLTAAGYRLKGELLVDAFQNTLARLNQDPDLTRLAMETDSIPLPQLMARDNMRMVPAAPASYRRDQLPSGELFYHRIRPGESLGSIAARYHVSVRSLQELNGLAGTRIYAGKSLKVIVRQPGSSVKPATETTASVKTPAGKSESATPNPIASSVKKTIRHQIASGETLSSIAEKYQVSVEDLKRLNRLRTSRIEAGKTLLIEIPASGEKKNKS